MPTRRNFIQTTAAFALASAIPTASAQAKTIKGRKLNIAAVGCGGKGYTDISGVETENLVGFCDVDFTQASKILKKHPNVPRFSDYRVMLDTLGDKVDAVTVSTPDHMHYAVGMEAIKRGKHTFIQKPLAHSLGEVRQLQSAARQHGVITQMGNQGHAGEGVRLVKEWIQAGAIGHVREVHMWTQKLTDGKYRSPYRDRPPYAPPVPQTLDWNLWLGTAPMRNYSAEYVPRMWRGWWDFGNGALGDIGCHTMDAAFYALNLTAPTTVQAQTSEFNNETFPDSSVITYQFPARDNQPPVKFVWYDGGKLPPRPQQLEPSRTFEAKHGYYIVGDKGVIYDPTEKCSSPRIIPETKMRELTPTLPPKTIPRVPNGNSAQEWVNACKGGPLPGSNFEYSGPLSETVLLGNLAIQARGQTLHWNPKNMTTGNKEIDKLINPPHRKF